MFMIYYSIIPTILGVVVCGGWNGGELTITEVFLPDSGKTCSLPSLPTPRHGHTLDQLGHGALIACGGEGEGALRTCDKFSAGTWSHHSTLVYDRFRHTSLPGQDHILLMGGSGPSGYSGTTTEIVGGGQQYNLQEDTGSEFPKILLLSKPYLNHNPTQPKANITLIGLDMKMTLQTTQPPPQKLNVSCH